MTKTLHLSLLLPLLHLRFLSEKHECPLWSSKVRDYSGTYTVKLLPCTTPSHQEYRLPVTCNPREPITFDLDIRFQQVCLTECFSRVYMCVCVCVCVCVLLSHVRLFATPWAVARQPPLSMGFSRQGYWSELPFPSPEDLPDPGIKPWSPSLRADSYHLSYREIPFPK